MKRRERLLLAASLAACLLYVSIVWGWTGRGGGLWRRGAQREVLVLYVFAHTDPEFLANLKFFVREAVEPDAGVCEYVIAVKRGHGLEVSGRRAAASCTLPSS